MPLVTVIVPTHNPDRDRLTATLDGLCQQTLPPEKWEVLLIDNASEPALDPLKVSAHPLPNLQIIRETTLGLNSARATGFRTAEGKLIVMVDDDNVLDPSYLEEALEQFSRNPKLGAAGGPISPEFATPPAKWVEEFHGLLALRDLGNDSIISALEFDPEHQRPQYPAHAPVGAGMVLRREIATQWAVTQENSPLTDRRGNSLSSSGDNDIIFTVLKTGWQVAYFPSLHLRHLIPAGRCEPSYLARLNQGIQRSWVQLLEHHGANPWGGISRAGTLPRKARAWWRQRAWRGPAEYIRWCGDCGRFDGLADIAS